MSGYCDIAPGHPLHGPYHDHEYGFPQREEAVLFERLLLEINQAGLSWETILKKRDGFRRAYDGFDVDRVAGERVEMGNNGALTIPANISGNPAISIPVEPMDGAIFLLADITADGTAAALMEAPVSKRI